MDNPVSMPRYVKDGRNQALYSWIDHRFSIVFALRLVFGWNAKKAKHNDQLSGVEVMRNEIAADE